MFDVQVKRIHEYKRQHLNLLHVVSLYKRLKDNPNLNGRAAHGDFRRQGCAGLSLAKLMIRLITAVADLIGRDPAMRGKLQVVFYPELQRQERAAIFPAPTCPSRSRLPARRRRAPAT
jgi:starch phosphorylase